MGPDRGCHSLYPAFTMKMLSILLCVAICAASCTSYSNGSEKLTQLGGAFYKNADGSYGVNNADSFRDGANAVKTVATAAIVTGGLVDGLGIAAGAFKSVTAAKEATKVAGIKAAQSTETAKISAQTAEAALKASTTTTP